MSRYIMIAGLSSIMTGLSYVGLIKIKIPVRAWPEVRDPSRCDLSVSVCARIPQEDQLPPKSSWQVS